MGTSRIEQLIEDIYDFIDGCRTQALSSNKVIVPKDHLYDLLDELRLRTPEEVKRYQKIIANRDTIISDAEAKATGIVDNATELAKKMLDESEIVKQAYQQASDIINAANAEANEILVRSKDEATELVRGAKEGSTALLTTSRLESDAMLSESYAYANDLLAMIESVLNATLAESRAKFDSLYATLGSSLNIVRDNREQINRQTVGPVPKNLVPEEPAVMENQEADFEYDQSENPNT